MAVQIQEINKQCKRCEDHFNTYNPAHILCKSCIESDLQMLKYGRFNHDYINSIAIKRNLDRKHNERRLKKAKTFINEALILMSETKTINNNINNMLVNDNV